MLLINAGVGFWEEFSADNAIAALKKNLALKARVLRGGEWREIDARALVPGDVVELRLGNIVPADVKLASGDYLEHRPVGADRRIPSGRQEEGRHRLFRARS